MSLPLADIYTRNVFLCRELGIVTSDDRPTSVDGDGCAVKGSPGLNALEETQPLAHSQLWQECIVV